MKSTVNETIQDTIQVGLANAGAIGISLASLNEILTTFSLCLAIGFTLYKQFKKK
tara:strand:- start:622 stop:786 length:165 start_codon:yes stop_codon:yes gene_type:complete